MSAIAAASLALLPSLVVLLAVLALRQSGLVAAFASMLVTLGLWLSAAFSAPAASQATFALGDAAVLAALVAAMVVPGILFVECTRRQKSPEAVGALVDAIDLPRPQAAILIAVGLGVMVESLTGMGVSLLVTVPLLLRLVDRKQAIGLALVGMSLMPWGALSISAHVGTKLSGLPLDVLTYWVSRVSGPVAFCLPLLCLYFVPERRPRDVGVALLAGAVLWAAIAASAHWAGIEVAGVIGGLAVIALLALLARRRNGLAAALAARGLRPYLVLLLAVIAQKLAFGPLERLGFAPALATDRVSFSVLTSPGVALLLATCLAAPSGLNAATLRLVAQRSWRPVASVALFMLAARLLVEIGAIKALAGAMSGLGQAGALITVAVLGAVGGFITGSGVTGNALFMPSAAVVGQTFGQLPLFVALQNGASGHVAMAALPVAAILITALGARRDGDDSLAMRIGLALGAWHIAVLIVGALVQQTWLSR